jgi:hypothetical protein
MEMPIVKPQKRLRQIELKWTPTLVQAGWTAFPSVLLERQQALGLDALDINILLHLIRHWWYADNLPHPSKKTIAKCIGIDESTVRRRIASMEQDGLIARTPRRDAAYGQQTNSYDLAGLIKALTPYAEEAIRVRKKRHHEDKERLRRKRPLLDASP